MSLPDAEAGWLRAGDPLDETTLRMLAELLRSELASLVPDPVAAAAIEAALVEALDQPNGDAHRALRRALSSEPVVRAWFGAQLERGNIRDRLLSAATDSGVPARFLTVTCPTRVEAGGDVPVQVWITERARDRSARCQPFAVPSSGIEVVLVVAAGPGSRVVGPAIHRVHVPERGDSEQVLFVLRADPDMAGTTNRVVTAEVRAYVAGRPVGDMSLSLQSGTGPAVPRTVSTGLPTIEPDPWNLTLEVNRTVTGYHCRLFHTEDHADGAITRIPTATVDAVRRHLRRLAQGSLGSDATARHDLRDLGLELWEAALPVVIRERFDDLLASAKTLSIVTNQYHGMPWELLLPHPRSRPDASFLAEIVPVLRRMPGQEYPALMTLRDAAYVDPPGTLTNTSEEITQVRGVLGARVRHRRPPFATQAELVPYLEAGEFDLLHLACHNSSPRYSWQEVAMADRPLYCFNLNQAVNNRSLGRRRPLVFFNACDSAGRAVDTAMTDWATKFLAAGAGAFIGSTWAVRSDTAMRFAVCLYEALRPDLNLDLGEATLRARQEVGGSDGDPTRLAYAVYATAGTRVSWATT